MGLLNNANKAQRQIILELFTAGNSCPTVLDRQSFDEYQARVMQPLRDAIIAAGSIESKQVGK
jgi:hypothetical protein